MSPHFVQMLFLNPLIEALSLRGAPTRRLLRKSRLDRLKIEQPTALAPLAAAIKLIEETARAETGAAVPREIAERYRIAHLSAWGHAILACPDLLAACRMAANPDARLHSNNIVRLTIHGPTAVFNDQYTTSNSLAQEWVALLSVCLLLDAFRGACGPDWKPLELDVAASDLSALDALFDLSGVVVRRGQPANRMRFRTRDLVNPMPEAMNSRTTPPGIPHSTWGCVVRLLDSLTPETIPCLNLVADMLDISPRTLQRKLFGEETNFFELCDHWRMTRALELLHDPRLSVAEVASRLHYSNTSHFVRAFRRWTSMTPSAYRRAGQHVVKTQ